MALKDDIQELETLIIKGLTDELTQQGHVMTGRLVKSLRIKTRIFLNGFEMEGSFFRYGAILDRGTKPSRIPFGNTTGAKTSKYIQGLVEFVKKRRIETNAKKALGVAFAIAKTQKKEGMPTKGSLAFSKNGRRIDWIDFGFEQINDQIFAKLGDIFGESFEGSIDNIIKRQNL
jgi:tartrate dehydratase beta subunit/fumarate hydratase class I family protein